VDGPEELRRRLDAMWADIRSDPPARPAPPQVASIDQATLDAAVEKALAERERQAAIAAAKAERERQEAVATGGPCRYCGITRSWEHDPETDRPIGRWHDDGRICAWCEADRVWGITGRTDHEHRIAALRSLLPPEVTKWWADHALPERTGFRWWVETPGAATSETDRFAYVDREALAARLADKPIQYETREPCRRCGCPHMWRHGTAVAPGNAIVETVECVGCRKVADLVYLTMWATGLSRPSVENLGTVAERVLGVHWWSDDPNGGAADPPRPCTIPFAYIDRQAARRRAFEVFGREDWAELRFGNPSAYAAARAAAS
jgi:hypothetical protein